MINNARSALPLVETTRLLQLFGVERTNAQRAGYCAVEKAVLELLGRSLSKKESRANFV